MSNKDKLSTKKKKMKDHLVGTLNIILFNKQGLVNSLHKVVTSSSLETVMK